MKKYKQMLVTTTTAGVHLTHVMSSGILKTTTSTTGFQGLNHRKNICILPTSAHTHTLAVSHTHRALV